MEIANGKTINGKPTKRSKTGHPHFHCVIHTDEPYTKEMAQKIRDTFTVTNRGHADYKAYGKAVDIKRFRQENAQYIAKYVGKQSKEIYGNYKAARVKMF